MRQPRFRTETQVNFCILGDASVKHSFHELITYLYILSEGYPFQKINLITCQMKYEVNLITY